MTDTSAAAAALAQHDADVAARWRELESGKLVRVIGIVNERARPIKQRHHKRVNAVLNNPAMTISAKIEALWEAVDEIGKTAAPHAACRRGCSHCCHTSVLMPAQEAALIGKRIGVKPAKVTGVTQRGDIESGYHNPCPFLKDGACSIYASRPLACRQQFNMDTDALLCELVGAPSKVPYLNMFDYQTALAMITATQRECIERDPRTGRPVPVTIRTAPDVGDIREFFPRGRS
ncbi:YkgJ family cysteine cluster protein [Paraburkholderia sp. RL18-103-BIB-C]|uniref:YkgJ family cysteine cluster protein n=1 Tax=Paraburkholderia sp. RL18-103-BIB-C TaxID=3031637 RepID=UPI0038BBD296